MTIELKYEQIGRRLFDCLRGEDPMGVADADFYISHAKIGLTFFISKIIIDNPDYAGIERLRDMYKELLNENEQIEYHLYVDDLTDILEELTY